MLRFLFNLIVLILLLAVIAGSFLWYKRTTLLVRYLATTIGAPVCADDFRIGWHTLTVTNLTVRNPAGGEVPVLFAAQSVEVDASIFAFLKREIQIPQIAINGCIIGVELFDTSGSDNTWTRVFQGHSDFLTAPSSDNSTFQTKRRLVVNDLLVYNLYLDLYSVPKKQHISVPVFNKVELTNIGAGVGMPLGSAAELIFNQLVTYVFDNLDLSDVLIQALGAQGQPRLEVPIRFGVEALKKTVAPPPATKPNIPMGKYCYSP